MRRKQVGEVPAELLRRPALTTLAIVVKDMRNSDEDTVYVDVTHSLLPGRSALDIAYDRVNWYICIRMLTYADVY
jgi:hypothetical protein